MGHPAGRQGSPVKQKHIDFRELLENLLPLDQLSLADRDSVARALRSGVARQIEDVALLALRQLEQTGAVRRVAAPANGGAPLVSYQSRDRLDVFTLELPGPTRRGAWLVFPRGALPTHIQTGLEQVQRLLRIDDPTMLTDPRKSDARGDLGERLQQAGRELLPASDVRYVPAGEREASTDSRAHPSLAADVLERPALVWYCADAARANGLKPSLGAPAAGSLVLAGITDSEGRGIGWLEISADGRDAYRPEDLALIALLADSCGAVLERASRLEKLVFVDALTSAYNRSYFDLQLEKEMARAQRERGSMALCIVDIDNFKNFNTAYGYQAGNEVLAQVAQALRRGVRPFDTVARWGGEEFAVLLTAPVQAQDVAAVSERLRILVERQVVALEGLDRRMHRVSVTVSIGVALYPDDADDAEDLWRDANQALLLAKRPPKNQVVFFGATAGRRIPRITER